MKLNPISSDKASFKGLWGVTRHERWGFFFQKPLHFYTYPYYPFKGESDKKIEDASKQVPYISNHWYKTGDYANIEHEIVVGKPLDITENEFKSDKGKIALLNKKYFEQPDVFELKNNIINSISDKNSNGRYFGDEKLVEQCREIANDPFLKKQFSRALETYRKLKKS